MTNMKKKLLFLLLLFLLLGNVVYIGFKGYQSQKIKEKKELEKLYNRQNTAFELCSNLNERKSYHGVDELRLNRIAIDLYVFNNIQSEYQVSVDEVKNYLAEEYDTDGKPMIYSMSENIKNYINWYFEDNGEDTVLYFGARVNKYLKEHDYRQHFYLDMNYEDVVEALEKYKNDPSYVPPKQDE